ncbi:hypothetical protein Q9R23_02680 [Exiguobacterium sp. BRG2]|uniref:hypothetical protein n=1 Tax=unclassified Exiguobacterium TaxID=2644629 RepID=UPI000E9CEE80|nr:MULTISPECIES: hypothetical protein [unclassified Exiguobacterium]MDT0171866.1 hypothetical protein [Exiguobacterium sp. BRG2]HBF58568.1 hypothetical protein [Exiguobacterium sp.]
MDQLKVNGIGSFTKFATNGNILKLKDATLGEVKLSLNEASSMTIAPVDEENGLFVIKGQQQESLVELTLPRQSCEVVHAWLLHKLKRHKKIRLIATS